MEKARPRLRKPVSLALAVVMALSSGMLFGCSRKTGTSSAATSGSSSAASQSKTPETIVWWTPGTESKDQDMVMQHLNALLAQKINVNLVMKFADDNNYDQKMNVIISSGTPYDICFTSSWANYFNRQAYKGAFLSINSLLDQYGQNLEKLIPKTIWSSATIGGKIYAVPTYKDSGNGLFNVFAEKYVEAAHFDYKNATTLESVTPYLAYIKKNYPSLTPLTLTTGDTQPGNGVFDDVDLICGNMPVVISMTDPTCKVINAYTDPSVLKNLHTLHQWYEDGYINKDAATATSYPSVRPYEPNVGWPAAVSIWSTGHGYPCVATQRGTLYISTNSIQGSMNAISVNSKHAAAAVKFLDLENTDPEVKNMLEFGVEGVNYEKTGSTSIKMLNNDYAMTQFTTSSFYDGLYTIDPAPKDEWTELQQYTSGAKPSPALGFILNDNDTQIQTEETLITNVYNKYYGEVNSGVADPDTVVPQLNAALDKAGLQKFIADVQKQVDAWKATK